MKHFLSLKNYVQFSWLVVIEIYNIEINKNVYESQKKILKKKSIEKIQTLLETSFIIQINVS